MQRENGRIISMEFLRRALPLKELVISVLCLVCLFSSPFKGVVSSRERPSIKDMAVINSGRDLLLYFRVVEPFTREMEKGIKNGIPVTFSFYVDLYKKRSNWLNKEMVSYRLERRLDYDNLKDEYKVKMSAKKDQVITKTSLEEAKNLMKELNDFAVIELKRLEPGGQYTIRAKASLEKKTLPFNFQNIIPFWNLWEFDTEWAELNFSVPASSEKITD